VKAKPTRNEPLLAFIHIEKCAGSTLVAILRTYYGAEALVSVGSPKDPDDAIARVRKIGRSQGAVRAIHGHIPFGARKYLPRETRFITVLREPAERTVSHYYHLVEARARPKLRPAVAELLPPRGYSLADTLEDGRFIQDNLQTRRLSGKLFTNKPCTPEMLAQAKDNLAERFLAFGLAERFDDSLDLFRKAVDLSLKPHPPMLVNPDRPRLDELEPEALRAAERHNVLDRELYLFAGELFEARVNGVR
jgi:Galactose-3-O-sulfotransferase